MLKLLAKNYSKQCFQVPSFHKFAGGGLPDPWKSVPPTPKVLMLPTPMEQSTVLSSDEELRVCFIWNGGVCVDGGGGSCCF